jgi:peptide deformylase
MKIITTPHPSLRFKAQEVKVWDKKLETQINQMISLLENSHDPKGVGLAATQVEEKNRIFLLTIDDKIETFINPTIIKKSQKMLADVYKTQKKRWLEGCLSIPTIWGFVNRPWEIEVTYQLKETLKTVTKSFTDFEAAAFQHELDHLNGVLFTDHVLEQKGVLYKEKGKSLEPVEF